MDLLWFPFWAGEWLNDGDVAAMSLEQQGAYMRLLCFQWRERSIPAESRLIHRMLGLVENEAEMLELVLAKFSPCSSAPGRLANARLERVREEIKAWMSSPASKRERQGDLFGAIVRDEERVQNGRARSAQKLGTKTSAYFLGRRACVSSDLGSEASSGSDPISEADPDRKDLYGPAAPKGASSANAPNDGIGGPGSTTDARALEFMDLYELYPRKRGMAEGLKSCRRQIKTAEEFDNCRKAIEALIAERREPRFIPYFSTFINQRRFEDKPEAESPFGPGTVMRNGRPLHITPSVDGPEIETNQSKELRK